MAYRRHLGEGQPRHPRTVARSPEAGSSAERGRGGFSGEVKSTAVGGQDRGYDGGKKVKGRKRHILVDTEGFVLKAKIHSAKVLDHEGIKTLLRRADLIALYSPECLERLSEKGGRGQQSSLTNHPKALFVLRIPANSAVAALLSPLS